MDNQSSESENHAIGLAPFHHLAQWRAEWDGRDRNSDFEPFFTPFSSSLLADQPGRIFHQPAYDDDPEGFIPGSVRVLSATVAGDTTRALHILVLDEEDVGIFRFAPFSDFSTPATDKELLISQDSQEAGFPCVIQAWNARDCPRDLLARSWFSRRVSEDVVRRTRILDRDLPLPQYAGMLVGTPVDEPGDSRHEYIAVETNRLDYLARLVLDSGKACADVIAFPDSSALIPVLAASAHPEERELDYHVWENPKSGARLHVSELIGHPGGYALRVEGDTASLFEGAAVLDGAGRRLGWIENGALGDDSHPLRFAGRSMRVVAADGSPLILARRPG